MHLSGKKLLLLGFIAILLIGIPVTIFVLQKQQETRIRAQKSTVLSFDPVSSDATPIQKAVGDDIPLSIVVDPGTNLVAWIRVVITYDQTKLSLTSGSSQSGGIEPFVINPATSFTFFNGPVYTDGKIEAELSVGADPTKALQNPVTLATINFKAIANTDGPPTVVAYSAQTQASSLGSGDQANEDVLSSTTPANILIGTSTATITTPTPTGGLTTITPTAPSGTTVTVAPTATRTPTPTTGAGAGGAAANQIPICSTLNVDRATTGTAPLSLTFTANGTDADGTISKATFDFGDGTPVDVTSGGGIGTNSASVQNAHTFNNPGSYAVKATFTDNSGGISIVGTCTQAVTVQAAPTTVVATLPPTGPAGLVIGFGAIAGILTLVGTLLFFAL